jgi:hypothetical protein
VKKAILQTDPPAELRIAIAWIHMLPLDSGVTARRAARTVRDPRVQHFHDPHKRAGAAVAASLAAAGKMAWDIYLFYAPGIGWEDGLPPPVAWAHQLKDSTWADPSRHHRGDDLVRQLEIAMAALRHAAVGRTACV